MRIKFLCILFIFFFVSTLSAQTVWENQSSEVYAYLYRFSQKGLIDFQDLIRPVSRQQIGKLLVELDAKKDQLSKTEKAELNFYLQEFKPIEGSENDKIHLVKKDENKRLRGLFIHNKDFQLNADPIGSLMRVSGTNKGFTQMSNGIEFWGQAKRWAFQFYYRDYTETGKGYDSFRVQSPEPGIIKLYDPRLTNPNETKQNFSEIKASISYTWNNGSLSFGKDNLIWGYGENGRTVLSNKAPTYPYIRFDYAPFKWMQFNYTHAWLNSNIIDSNASYSTGNTGVSGDLRILYVPKFMATHTLIFKPTRGLDIAIGESIVYSDKLDIGFLIPINFFKIYDNNRSNYVINAGSNGQYFMQVSSRNHLKNTHLYGSLFIDELKVSSMFDPVKKRNQLGYTIGGSITDLLLPYLTIGAEYTRVNPFVYSNLIPAQFYTQYSSPLGDWMGNNFDRQTFFLKYTPIPKLKTYLRFQSIRKGGSGTIAQQYLVQPQPGFLFDFQKKRTDLFLQASYELINNFYLTGSYQMINQTLSNGSKTQNNTVQIGVSYGLR
jgi:hypothetical protein